MMCTVHTGSLSHGACMACFSRLMRALKPSLSHSKLTRREKWRRTPQENPSAFHRIGAARNMYGTYTVIVMHAGIPTRTSQMSAKHQSLLFLSQIIAASSLRLHTPSSFVVHRRIRTLSFMPCNCSHQSIQQESGANLIWC